MFDNKYEKLSTEKLLQDKNIDDTTKQTLMDNHYKEYQYDVNDLSGAEQIDELWNIQATGQSSGKARYSHLAKAQERKDSNVDVKNFITQYLQNTAIQDNDSIFNRQTSNSFFQEHMKHILYYSVRHKIFLLFFCLQNFRLLYEIYMNHIYINYYCLLFLLCL